MDVDEDRRVNPLSRSLPSRWSAVSHSRTTFSASDATSLVPLLENLRIYEETSTMNVDSPLMAFSPLSFLIVPGDDALMDVELSDQPEEHFDVIMDSPPTNHSSLPGSDLIPCMVGRYIEGGQDKTPSLELPVVASKDPAFPGPGLEPASQILVTSGPNYVPAKTLNTLAPPPLPLGEVDSSEVYKGVQPTVVDQPTKIFGDMKGSPNIDTEEREIRVSGHGYTFNIFDYLGELFDENGITHLDCRLDPSPFAMSALKQDVREEGTAWLVERLRDLGKRLVKKRAFTKRRHNGPGRFTPYTRSTTLIDDEGDSCSPELLTSRDTEELLGTPEDISDPFLRSPTDSLPSPVFPSDLAIPVSESNSTCSTTPTEESYVSLRSISSFETLDPIFLSTIPLDSTDPTSTDANRTQTPIEDGDPNPKIVSPPNDDPKIPGHYPIDELELSDYSHPSLFSRIYPKHASSFLQWAVESIFGW